MKTPLHPAVVKTPLHPAVEQLSMKSDHEERIRELERMRFRVEDMARRARQKLLFLGQQISFGPTPTPEPPPSVCRAIEVTLAGCNHPGFLVGAGWTVTLKKDGNIVDQQTTGADSKALLSAPTTGSYTIESQPPRFQLGSINQNIEVCGDLVTRSLPLTPHADFACSTRCGFPLKKTLYIHDGFNEHAITWSAGTWSGSKLFPDRNGWFSIGTDTCENPGLVTVQVFFSFTGDPVIRFTSCQRLGGAREMKSQSVPVVPAEIGVLTEQVRICPPGELYYSEWKLTSIPNTVSHDLYPLNHIFTVYEKE